MSGDIEINEELIGGIDIKIDRSGAELKHALDFTACIYPQPEGNHSIFSVGNACQICPACHVIIGPVKICGQERGATGHHHRMRKHAITPLKPDFESLCPKSPWHSQ